MNTNGVVAIILIAAAIGFIAGWLWRDEHDPNK